jgi:hypothetical protein
LPAKKKQPDELVAAMEAAETFGQKKLTETLANKAPPRPKLHTDAEKALEAGLPIPLLTFASKLNAYQNIHTQSLHHFYGTALSAYESENGQELYEAARDALAKYPLTGTNTYAKAMARYREVLLAGSATDYLIARPLGDALEITPLHKRSRLPTVNQEKLPLDVVGQKIAATKAKGKKVKTVAVGTEQPNAMQVALKSKPSILDHAVSDEELKAMSAGAPTVIGVDLASGPDQTAIGGVLIEPEPGVNVMPNSQDFFPTPVEAVEALASAMVAPTKKALEADDPNVDAPAPDEFEEPSLPVYGTKVAAKTAAIAAMGPEAIEGLDFKTQKVVGGWIVKPLAI